MSTFRGEPHRVYFSRGTSHHRAIGVRPARHPQVHAHQHARGPLPSHAKHGNVVCPRFRTPQQRKAPSRLKNPVPSTPRMSTNCGTRVALADASRVASDGPLLRPSADRTRRLVGWGRGPRPARPGSGAPTGPQSWSTHGTARRWHESWNPTRRGAEPSSTGPTSTSAHYRGR